MYTRQILNDVESISKQRRDIAQKIEEIKLVQKDINLLVGKLLRTYAEANNKVFEVKTLFSHSKYFNVFLILVAQ